MSRLSRVAGVTGCHLFLPITVTVGFTALLGRAYTFDRVAPSPIPLGAPTVKATAALDI